MRVLRDKTGASMIFVLAVMLLLMAIGVSAVTAAGYNHGAGMAQVDRNQLDIYVSSMERTINAALNKSIAGKTPVTNVSSLGGKILREAYDACNESANCTDLHTLSYTLTPDVPNEWGVTYTIDITAVMNVYIVQPVYIYDFVTIETGELNGVPTYENIKVVAGRVPMEAHISGEIKVRQTTHYNDPVISNTPISSVTETTYSCSNIFILEDETTLATVIDETTTNYKGLDVDDGDMLIESMGEWAVIKHEKIG